PAAGPAAPRPAGTPHRPDPWTPAQTSRRPASAAATRTPNYTRPAAAAPPPAAQPPPRTTPRPATAPSPAWPAQRRTGHHHPDPSYPRSSPPATPVTTTRRAGSKRDNPDNSIPVAIVLLFCFPKTTSC